MNQVMHPGYPGVHLSFHHFLAYSFLTPVPTSSLWGVSDSPLENAQKSAFKEPMWSTQTKKYSHSFFHSFGCRYFKYLKIYKNRESPAGLSIIVSMQAIM